MDIFYLDSDIFDRLKLVEGRNVRRDIDKENRDDCECICQLAYQGQDGIFRCSMCFKYVPTRIDSEETVFIKKMDHITKHIEIEYNEFTS